MTLTAVPGKTTCRALFVPDSEECLAIVRGAINELIEPHNWSKYGALSEQESADAFVDMFNRLCNAEGPCRVIGEIIQYAGATSPNVNWLVCDGSDLASVDWPDLFAVIGTTYGSSGSGRFYLPDFRGRAAAGAGTGTSLSTVTLGEYYGEESHALTENEGPTHTHTDTGHVHSEGNAAPTAITIGPGVAAPSALPSVGITGSSSASLTNSGLGTPHNTIGPRIGINFLIVAKDG